MVGCEGSIFLFIVLLFGCKSTDLNDSYGIASKSTGNLTSSTDGAFVVDNNDSSQEPAIQKSKKEIIRQIIRESINSYPGSCPCPYIYTKNGSRCGKRSAYSKPGGYSPICYEHDVTEEMIKSRLE